MDSARRAAFILGIEHRSGTNFLSDLLALHPDCCRPKIIYEDFLVHRAADLVRFAEGLHGYWDDLQRTEYPTARIGAALGRGLLDMLWDHATGPGRCYITKTPRADQAQLFPWLFPDQRLILLVRDGKAVVESLVKSFRWSYRKAMIRWARGARSILRFDRDHRGGPCRYVIVRYEDLLTDLPGQVERLLAFLDLDPAQYDFAAAANLPVRGSSTTRERDGHLHWQPVQKDAAFQPLQRASHWTAALHRRFVVRCGGYQRLLGYDASIPGAGRFDQLFQGWLSRRWERKLACERLASIEPANQPAATIRQAA
jgi:hypothetical protein